MPHKVQEVARAPPCWQQRLYNELMEDPSPLQKRKSSLSSRLLLWAFWKV